MPSIATRINEILNKHDLAAIIGNGIHLYQEKHRNINYAKSWNNLLIEIWDTYNSKTINNNIFDGVSYTEFYDLIELICNRSYEERFGRLFDERTSRLRDLGLSQKDQQAITSFILSLAQKNSKPKQCYSDLIKKRPKIADKLLNNKGIRTNRTEDLDLILDILSKISNSSIKVVLTNGIKSNIASSMLKWNNEEVCGPDSTIAKIGHRLREQKCPIMTTNFDTTFSTALDLKYCKVAPITTDDGRVRSYEKSNRGFTDYYAWNGYFGDGDINQESPTDCFGVWHINGLIKYPRSIKLGLCDYMGAVGRARSMIQGDNGLELFRGKYQEHWAGENTWLHLIFNKNLLIFGLNLDENEVFLRWLLLQRAKYFSMHHDMHHDGWYLMTEKERQKNPGKVFFLEHVGIEVVVADSFDDIYTSIGQ